MNDSSLFSRRSYIIATVEGAFMLVLALASVMISTNYANVSASNSVTDIILSNTRVYDVDGVFVYGALALIVFSILILCTIKRHSLPFVLKSVSVFLVIRSVFVSLTHISPYPSQVVIPESFLSSYSWFHAVFTGDDLFFSGHVGLTFLMALLFWDAPLLRYLYLVLSVVFAVVVLLGHIHYSIDVFAAYFITYSIYALSLYVFNTDHERASHYPV